MWGKMDGAGNGPRGKTRRFWFSNLKVNNKIYQQHPKSDGRVVFSMSEHFGITSVGYPVARAAASQYPKIPGRWVFF